MKIAVAGMGYVGLANAVLLAQHHQVVMLDINEERVNKLNKNISPISDEDIEYFLENKNMNIEATTQSEMAYKDADMIIITTTTNYDPDRHYFDTKSVESVINEVLKINTETD